MSLSAKERMYLQEAWEQESLCLAKYNVYADMCQDQTIGRLFADIARRKQDHAHTLAQLLNQP